MHHILLKFIQRLSDESTYAFHMYWKKEINVTCKIKLLFKKCTA